MPNAEGLYTKDEHEAAITAAIKERTKNHSEKVIKLEEDIAAANKELRAAQKLTSDAETFARERDEARAELALTKDGLTLTRHGVTDDRGAKRLRDAYRSDTGELAAEKRPSFEDWLKGDGADDLKRYQPPGTKIEPDPKAGDPKPGVTTVTAGARPAGGQAVMTPTIYAEQMSALVASRGAAPKDGRAAIDVQMAALRAQAPKPA